MGKTMRAGLVLPWVLDGNVTLSVPYLPAEVASPNDLYDKSRALIIGIEQYPQGPTVPGAVEDGKLVAQAFRQIGFQEIIELYNKEATARRLQQVLTDLFSRKVDRSGRVIVFFVAHR